MFFVMLELEQASAMTTANHRQHHIIYIPGLGDSNTVRGQRFLVSLWRNYGIHGHCYQMVWADKEPFQPKFDRLLSLIDELHAQGQVVSLIGSSAGASVALHAFAARKQD